MRKANYDGEEGVKGLARARSCSALLSSLLRRLQSRRIRTDETHKTRARLTHQKEGGDEGELPMWKANLGGPFVGNKVLEVSVGLHVWRGTAESRRGDSCGSG